MLQYIFGAGMLAGTYVGYKLGQIIPRKKNTIDKFRDILIATRMKVNEQMKEGRK